MKKTILILFLISLALCSCSKTSLGSGKTSGGKVDLDFTKMNFNMVSSVTFEILVEPEKYINKTAKISGQFYSQENEGIINYAVINWDATGCCPSGLDFLPPPSMTKFPEPDTPITVYGHFVNSPDGNLILQAEEILL